MNGVVHIFLKLPPKANTTTRRIGVQELSRHDLAELRLVCQGFQRAIDPYLFNEINFDFGPEFTSGRFSKLQKAPKYLDVLIEGTSPLCHYAKTLRINYAMKIDKTLSANPVRYSADTVFRAIVSLKNVRVVQCVFLVLIIAQF